MVHNNPGEDLTKTDFNDPLFLKKGGYTGQVMNDFIFPHTAILFKKLNPHIFEEGTKEWIWIQEAVAKIRENIKKAHAAGIQVYYFTDIIVLPKKLVEIYHDEICDAQGRISFEKPKTIEIHKIMLDELFETFPDLDGLVIRTGETYLNNVPYHTGNGPITNGASSHIKLISLLRDEVCVKRNKKIFYRTWSFGGMHDSASYYLNVVNAIPVHENLIFSIKHTQGDYHRTFKFNPTLGIGKHPQIVEVQCQREYEGKGAYPNYVMDGVINGFEEYKNDTSNRKFNGLKDLKGNPNLAGVWSWSRGGGWRGPYIKNEFWCKLNAYVISHWGQDTTQSEEQVFNQFMTDQKMNRASKIAFRKLCLLSAKAVIRGHESAKLPFDAEWVWWMRDDFLSGLDANSGLNTISSEGSLLKAFQYYYQNNLLSEAVQEKYEAVALWKQILDLSSQIIMENQVDQEYVKVSSEYGYLLHRIIAEAWNIMALGYTGDQTHQYDVQQLKKSIHQYDLYWQQYFHFQKQYASAASLYKPFAFVYQGPEYHLEKGMDATINKYRKIAMQNGNKPERLTWFENLGFGMFIHWNVDVSLGVVISHSMAGASDAYNEKYINELPTFFNPTKFDPTSWAKQAKIAGMKYVVFTAKHHSGFCMFNTATTSFNVMNTPFKKDILKEVVDAFRKEGIAIGIYYSPDDFYYLYKHQIPVGRMQLPAHFPSKNEGLMNYDKQQINELLTHYGKIDMLFLDGPADGLKEYAWELDPNIIVTRGEMKTPEQTIPDEPLPRPWESNYTMGTDWQYKPTNDPAKSGTDIINKLIEIRAKGGNFLLNVGPKADGEIQIEHQAILQEVALWNFVNAESIYKVKPLPIIKEGNIWYTQSNDEKFIYAFVLRNNSDDWKYGERKSFLLTHIQGNKDTKVQVLGYKSELVEYKVGFDASLYMNSSELGLLVSCVNGQRFYTNNQWPNPVVLKIENATFNKQAKSSIIVNNFDGAK